MRALLPGRDYFPPRVLLVPVPMEGTTTSTGAGIPDPVTGARPAGGRPARGRPPACRPEDILGKRVEPGPTTA